MNKISLLERQDLRVPVETPPLTEFERDELYQKARALGYVHPEIKAAENARAAVERKRALLAKPLASALSKVHPMPFTLASVNRYREKTTKSKLQLFSLTEHTENMRTYGLVLALGTLLNVLLLMICGSAVTIFANLQTNYGLIGCIPIFTLIFFSVYMTVSGIAFGASSTHGEDWLLAIGVMCSSASMPILLIIFGPRDRRWKRVEIQFFEEDIPQSTIKIATEIKSLCPDTAFYVEELVDKKDRFLIGMLGAEEYYLDFWRK